MPYTPPQVSDAAIITVEGDIGPAAVIALQRRIVRALDTRHPRIVVDLAGTTGTAGATLSLFCAALRFVERCGATLALAACPPEVRRAVDRSELPDVEFHPSVHAALTNIVHNRRASAMTKGPHQHA